MKTKKCKICGILFICYTDDKKTMCCECTVKKQIGKIAELSYLKKEIEEVNNEIFKAIENKEKE